MKSEHRHELKTNELADWLSHAPEWFKENSRVLSGAAVVILVAAGLYYWNAYNKNVRLPQQRLRLYTIINELGAQKGKFANGLMSGQPALINLSTPIEDLGSFAQASGNKTMAATAYLQQAKAIRAQLHLASTMGEVQFNEADIQRELQMAQISYEKAKELAGTDRNILAAAEYGLGLCKEELGEFGQAQQIYQGILGNADLAGSAVVSAVKYRMKVLAETQTPISFPNAPEPVVVADPNTATPADIVGDAIAPILSPAPDSNGTGQ